MGAALSKAGAERTTPLATATLVIAANAPDVDVLSFLGGEYFALSFRRGVTHGWPALLVLPFVVTGAVLAWDRWIRRRRVSDRSPARPGPTLALSALGLATHPTLDWMNTYGMRWGLPFDGSWTYGDALFIIDPWIWLALGGAVFLASRPGRRGLAGWGVLALLTSALIGVGMGGGAVWVWLAGLLGIAVASRVRGAGSSASGRAIAATLGAVTVYIIGMVTASRAARAEVFETMPATEIVAEDVMIAPSRGNPFRSNVVVRTPDAYVRGTYEWLRRPRVVLLPDRQVAFLTLVGAVNPSLIEPVLAAARARPVIRDYLVWSRYPYVRLTREAAGWSVRYSDARYDEQPEAGGLAGVTVHISSSEVR